MCWSTVDGERVRFYHRLTREALYTTVFPPHRRAMHARIGEVLSKRPSVGPDAVAHHFDRAGTRVPSNGRPGVPTVLDPGRGQYAQEEQSPMRWTPHRSSTLDVTVT